MFETRKGAFHCVRILCFPCKIDRRSQPDDCLHPCELDKIQVTATEVYRPGILLAGYYENFDSKRIQIIGLTEMSYLDELSTSLRNTHLEKLFSFQPPAIVLTRGMQPLSEMMQFAKQYGVPILMSTEMTSALMGQLITTLNTELAPASPATACLSRSTARAS